MDSNRVIAFCNDLIAMQIDFSPNPDIPIPQEEYPQNRKNFVADPPIEFQCIGASGVHLRFAEHATFRVGDLLNTVGMLDGESESTFNTTSSKITLRILWEGCQPFNASMNIECKVGGVSQKISKAMLAHNIAKIMKKFYEGYQRGEKWNSSSNSSPEKIPFETLVLLELRHISKNSYQPVLVARTFTENPPP